MEALPANTLTEPTHIVCASLVNAENRQSSALNGLCPCTNWHTRRTHVPLNEPCTLTSLYMPTLILMSLQAAQTRRTTNVPFKCLSVWWEAIIKRLSHNSKIIAMTRHRISSHEKGMVIKACWCSMGVFKWDQRWCTFACLFVGSTQVSLVICYHKSRMKH